MRVRFRRYIDTYGVNSIIIRNFSKICIAFLLAVAIPLSAVHFFFVSYVKKDFVINGKIEAQKPVTVVEGIFRDMEYLAVNIFTNENIQLFCINKGDAYDEAMKKALLLYSNINLKYKGVYIYKPATKGLYNFEGEVSEEKKKEIGWIDKLEGMKSDYSIELQTSNYDTFISFAFLKKDSVTGGIVIVEIDNAAITKALKDVSDMETVTCIFKNDKPVYKSSKNFADERLFSGEKEKISGATFYSSVNSEYYDELKYGVAVNINNYKNRISSTYTLIGVVMFCIFIFTTAMAYIISGDNVGYIIKLMDLLEKNKKPTGLKDNEVKYIADKVISLVNDNEKMKKEIEDKIKEYNSVSVKALQAQISPHFFNNSLNAVNYQLKTEYGYGSKTSEMLCRLSRIIGSNYINEEIFTSLEEEFSYIQDYIEFLKVRYGDFHTEFTIEKGLEKEEIVKMCLQPFVENAVFHGFSKEIKEKNVIKIEARKEEDFLVLTIFDNGSGMEEEKIGEILAVTQKSDFGEKNMGMKNVIRRLKLVYADRFDVKIESECGLFTKITLKIQNNQGETINDEKN